MSQGPTANRLGAFLMIGSMAAFTCNDVLIKLVGGSLPLFQMVVLRGVVATVLIYGLARYLGRLRFDLARRDWSLVLARGICEVITTYFFLTALMVMPIANITAVLQALPLTVTLGAALIYRERVGWRRLAAILIGLIGVLLIIRPGPSGFAEGAIFVVLAVFFITIRDLCARGFSASVPSMTVTFVTSAGVTLCAGIASLGTDWKPVSVQQGGLLAIAAVFIFAGYLCSVAVMRVGDVSFTSPFRYTGLLWALLLGFLVFGEWPDALTLLGAALVVGTGVFTLIRERQLARG